MLFTLILNKSTIEIVLYLKIKMLLKLSLTTMNSCCYGRQRGTAYNTLQIGKGKNIWVTKSN